MVGIIVVYSVLPKVIELGNSMSYKTACAPRKDRSACTSVQSDQSWQGTLSVFVCVEVLLPSQPNWSCQMRSVYLTTSLLGRLSPLSG